MLDTMKQVDGLTLKGRITIRSHPVGTCAEIRRLRADDRPWESLALLHSGTVESVTENLIMTGSLTGRDLIVQWLLGNAVANSIQAGINYIAIGTSATAATAADTQLTAETNRAVIALATDTAFNEASLQAFFPDGVLANGTYREVGAFVNGGSGANTGKLFNHGILGVAYVKTASVDTTIEIDISFT